MTWRSKNADGKTEVIWTEEVVVGQEMIHYFSVVLRDDQLDKIADRVIEKLEST
jgi:hypothetical protein